MKLRVEYEERWTFLLLLCHPSCIPLQHVSLFPSTLKRYSTNWITKVRNPLVHWGLLRACLSLVTSNILAPLFICFSCILSLSDLILLLFTCLLPLFPEFQSKIITFHHALKSLLSASCSPVNLTGMLCSNLSISPPNHFSNCPTVFFKFCLYGKDIWCLLKQGIPDFGDLNSWNSQLPWTSPVFEFNYLYLRSKGVLCQFLELQLF